MTCPAMEELFAYLEDEISVMRASEIEAHLSACRDCGQRWRELRSITNKIESEPGEFGNPAFVERVVARVKQGEPPAKRSWASRWLIAATASLAAAGLLFAALPLDGDVESRVNDGFGARGSKTLAADRWISFQVLRPQRDSHVYARVEQAILTESQLVFSVGNAQESPYRYLMILGLQSDGRVFWYHPAYEDPQDNPQSIAIETSDEPIHLREEIGHDLKPGFLRLFALFSKEPLNVWGIEKMITDRLSATQGLEDLGRLPIPGTGQQSLRLRVVVDPETE